MIRWMLAVMHRIAGQQHGIGPLARQYGERAGEIVGAARLDRGEREAQARRRVAHLFEDHRVGDVVGIPQQRDARRRRDDLLDELQPLRAEVRRNNGVAGDVAARMRKALHQSGPHRIADQDHDDRDGRCGGLGGAARRRAIGHDHVDRQTRQIGRRCRKPPGIAVGAAIFESDGLSFDIARLAQRLPERLPDRPVVDDADARDFRSAAVARARRAANAARPRRREAR